MMKNVITQEVNEEGKIIRRVHSFVRHRGRLTSRQENALQILWPKMGLDFIDKPLLFDSLFGNDLPMTLEIGFGMGTSLVTMAKKYRDKNFLGIEVHMPGIGACLAAAEAEKLGNLRIICHDAIEVLEKMLPDASLNVVQLFFPDPWHKVKHNKRRIVQSFFAELVLHKLELGGVFHMATDWQPYAEHMLSVMREIRDYRNLSKSGDYMQRPTSRPVTKFEKRGQKLGHSIFDLMFEKINTDLPKSM